MHYLRNIIDNSIQDIKELFSEYEFDQLKKDQFPQKTLIAAWKGSINCAGHKIDIIIGIPPSFPDELPKIYLTRDFKFSPVPHVDNNRFVCTFNPNVIDLFSERPKDIVVETIENARAIISDGILGKNKIDFEDEFLAYWSDGEITGKLYSILTIHNSVTKIKLASIKANNIDGMIAGDSEEEIRKYIQNFKPKSIIDFQDGLFIPLGPPPEPPFPTINKDIFSLLRSRDKNLAKTVIDFLINHKYKGVFIFSVNINNKVALAAWYHSPPSMKFLTKGFRPNKVAKNILMSRLSSKKIIRCSVERLESERLYKRIGQDFSEMRTKKVCLIGCGSIGSNIAMHLVKSGIEELILIDDEILLPENVYRHVCGINEVDQHKSKALSKKIASHFPHITTVPYTSSFHGAVLKDPTFLHSSNLIISATGNTSLERRLNHMQLTSDNFTPLLFTWIEPYGVACHAVLISNKNEGCFECCLDRQTLEFKYSVGKYNKGDNLIQETGCQTAFSPYSAIHSDLASIIATKLVLSFFNGEIHKSKRSVLINDIQILENNNIQMNPIYKNVPPNTMYEYSIERQPSCPCCGS